MQTTGMEEGGVEQSISFTTEASKPLHHANLEGHIVLGQDICPRKASGKLKRFTSTAMYVAAMYVCERKPRVLNNYYDNLANIMHSSDPLKLNIHNNHLA
jgi:hypothetical protein